MKLVKSSQVKLQKTKMIQHEDNFLKQKTNKKTRYYLKELIIIVLLYLITVVLNWGSARSKKQVMSLVSCYHPQGPSFCSIQPSLPLAKSTNLMLPMPSCDLFRLSKSRKPNLTSTFHILLKSKPIVTTSMISSHLFLHILGTVVDCNLERNINI